MLDYIYRREREKEMRGRERGGGVPGGGRRQSISNVVMIT
jgi:hypothetical protein